MEYHKKPARLRESPPRFAAARPRGEAKRKRTEATRRSGDEMSNGSMCVSAASLISFHPWWQGVLSRK